MAFCRKSRAPKASKSRSLSRPLAYRRMASGFEGKEACTLADSDAEIPVNPSL